MITPGPWKLSSTYPLNITADGGEYIVSPGGLMPSGKDNARLIAAAPDLLKAAKHFSVCEFAGTSVEFRCSDCRAGQAAIAKAEGR